MKNNPAKKQVEKNEKEIKPLNAQEQQDLNEWIEKAENERTRKPGSQSNSSYQHNNGRGGGK